MPYARKQTRYAADRDGLVCLLLDVRKRFSPHKISVWSYSRNAMVDLFYQDRAGRQLIQIETPEAKRWHAISVPRWLAVRAGLYAGPDLPPVMSGFCRDKLGETLTAEDAERSLAQFVVDQKNRNRRLPGQNWN